jgi:hypothetical protein
MATTRADAWQENSLRAERPPAPARRTPPPPLPPLPSMAGRGRPSGPVPGELRGRSADRGPARDDPLRGERAVRGDLGHSRPPAARRPVDPGRGPARASDRWDDDRRPGRPDDERRASRRPADAERPVSDPGGSRLRGVVAVLCTFLVTLAGGAVDWFTGGGLGMITLVALVASTSVATLLVRRRDVISVVLSPPLVFVAVAGANIALSPAVNLSVPTVATLLIRGFPTMAAATCAALLLALVRVVTRR